MKADPRGVVEHLRRAERVGDKPLADFLADEIVRHLERLDAIEEGAESQGRDATEEPAGYKAYITEHGLELLAGRTTEVWMPTLSTFPAGSHTVPIIVHPIGSNCG